MEENRKRSLDLLKQELRSVAEAVKKDELRKRSISSMDVRRERLAYILELFRENPSLSESSDTSYSRIPSQLAKRHNLWESITVKVNRKFAMKLEEITVEQVKKNMLYAKKREEGSYDNIKDEVVPGHMEYPSVPTLRHHGLSHMDVKIKYENISRESTPEESESEYPYSVSNRSLTSQDQIEQTTLVHNVTHNHATSSKSQVKKDRKMAKERAAYIADQAEYYIKRIGLDTTARSMAVNIERTNMWIKIVQKTNDKYSDRLPPIGLEQAKKQYSNYKIKDRPKSEGASSSFFNETQSTKPVRSSTRFLNNAPVYKIENIEIISPGDHPMGDISTQPKMESLEQCKQKLKDQDAQIKILKKKIEGQAKDYANRVNMMMEMVKVAVSKSTQEEIARAMA